MSKKNDGGDIIRFYEHRKMQEFIKTYHNPNFDAHQIKIPFRMAIIASSGGGKTHFLLNMLAKMPDTFGHIFVLYKASEPLYEFLEKSIGGDRVTFFTNIAKFPRLEDLPKDKQILCVFDDCVTYSERHQEIIKEYFIRGRKVGLGVSSCYLSQSFYKIPRLIRLQCSYLIILKVGNKRDIRSILSECSLGVEQDELTNMYKNATRESMNFLKIDVDNSDANKKFSHNWTGFYHVENEDSDG
jgi:hypothetical protein